VTQADNVRTGGAEHVDEVAAEHPTRPRDEPAARHFASAARA